jgi:hypothetical protein
MSYFDKYQKYKNKYNKLKLLKGGLKEFTLYDIFYNDELKELRKGFAIQFKEKLSDIIKDLVLLLDNCGKDNLVRNISLYSVNINIDSVTKKISFSLNKNAKCENSEEMRKYMESEIMPIINKYNDLIKYIRKCQKTAGIESPLYYTLTLLKYIKNLRDLRNLNKKNENIENDVIDINKENEIKKIINNSQTSTISDTINIIHAKILTIKKHCSEILTRTDFRFLSPEALKFLYDLKGKLNYDDVDFIKYRNNLIKTYEPNYKELNKDYPMTLQEQMDNYNKILPTGPTQLTSEFNSLLEHLYSPSKDVGKLKDYIYKIEVYTFGLILMEIVKFIETYNSPVESKYKDLIANITHYDIRMRPTMYDLQNKIKKF